jgi:hypothetical protein
MGKDVMGFNSTETAQSYVASNLGTVQYTIFFSNMSLWETSYMSPLNVAIPTNMSYVIFYNDTQDDNDPRSDAYNLNVPLLVLQKEIETAYLTAFEGNFQGYDAKYGQFWQQEAAFLNGTAGNSTTPCDWSRRPDLANLGTVMPWVIVFSFLFMATITFNLIADEKRNKLFGFLRRLGLMDSAYWLSWFLVFQVMLLVACAIAMIGNNYCALLLLYLVLVLPTYHLPNEPSWLILCNNVSCGHRADSIICPARRGPEPAIPDPLAERHLLHLLLLLPRGTQ